MERCGLKNCNKPMGPGAAAVGFDNEGKIDEVRVCPDHAWLIMTSPRGTFRIEPDRTLKEIPARRIII